MWMGSIVSTALASTKNAALNQDIESQRFLPGEAFVIDQDYLLVCASQATQSKFLEHAPLIDGLDQPRPLIPMHLYGCSDNRFRKPCRLLEQWMHGFSKVNGTDRREQVFLS